MAETENTESSATEALIDVAVDSWKFARLFTRVISKLDAGEQARYANQVRFFQNRIESAAEVAGARIVTIEGQPFEPGLAASTINLQAFGDGRSEGSGVGIDCVTRRRSQGWQYQKKKK